MKTIEPNALTVKFTYPPNHGELVARFGNSILRKGVVFTYGTTLYNPEMLYLSDDLMMHETVHMFRQWPSPEAWWDKYIKDDAFRFKEELLAYREQYKAYCEKHKDRNERARFLYAISAALAGPMYGDMMSQSAASHAIAVP